MFFSPKNKPDFEECYATERPYTDIQEKMHCNKESIFLPTVLADLTQLVQYFIKGDFKETRPHLFQEQQAEVHIALKELCQSKSIINEESKWDSYVDQQLKLLENHYLAQNDPTYLLDLAYKQLISGEKIVKRVMYSERDAAENQQTLFWRVSHHGHASDTERNSAIHKKISFGDSLFSGYLWDGVMHSDIEVSHSNYSACVYSYYDTHRQGREKFNELESTGYITTGKHYKVKNNLDELSPGFQNYIKTLDRHELDAVKFYNEELSQKNRDVVYIPSSTISSAACYQAGEDFHPSVVLSGDNSIDDFLLTSFY